MTITARGVRAVAALGAGVTDLAGCVTLADALEIGAGATLSWR
jgi:hypothetical protein